jgi:hypothetical protein
MHHKIHTFEHLNKHLALVIQDCFYDYMSREFSFAHLGNAKLGDSFHIHVYSLDEAKDNSLRLSLRKRVSTDSGGIAASLGLQAEAKIELEAILHYLEARISANTLLLPV